MSEPNSSAPARPLPDCLAQALDELAVAAARHLPQATTDAALHGALERARLAAHDAAGDAADAPMRAARRLLAARQLMAALLRAVPQLYSVREIIAPLHGLRRAIDESEPH